MAFEWLLVQSSTSRSEAKRSEATLEVTFEEALEVSFDVRRMEDVPSFISFFVRFYSPFRIRLDFCLD